MSARPFDAYSVVLVLTGMYRLKYTPLEDVSNSLDLISFLANRRVTSIERAKKLLRPRRAFLLKQFGLTREDLANKIRVVRGRLRWWRKRSRKVDDLIHWLKTNILSLMPSSEIYLQPIPPRYCAG